MTQQSAAEQISRRSKVLRSLLNWPLAWLLAVMLLMVGFPGGPLLDQSWLQLTTSWSWQSSAPPPRYTLDPAKVPDGSLVVWPSGWQLGPVSGPMMTLRQGLSDDWPDWAAALITPTLPKVAAGPASTPLDLYWQPAQHGYKSLLYRSDQQGLLLDAQLTLMSDADWAYKPGRTLHSTDQQIAVNWQGAVLLAEFMVPEAEFEPLTAAPLPKLAHHQSPGLAALREHWALQQGFYLVTPFWLSILTALAMALPWLLPRYLARPVWAGPLTAVIWIGLNLALAVTVRWWLPLWYPLLSLLLAVLWHRRLQRGELEREQLLAEYQSLALNWLRHLLDDGKTEAGQRFVDGSASLAIDPELTYELGMGFEKKRQYEQALACYQRLNQLAPGYRDSEQRLSQLKPLNNPSQTLVIGGNTTTRPIATAAGVQAPEIGRYRILGELGRGAMGVVYEAEDPRISRRVALKVVQLDALAMDEADSVKQRFFQEAQAAGRLNHPNIVTVYDVGEERDLAYIAMDRLTGQSLSDRLEQKPGPAIAKLCDWIAQAADALDFAHRNDIIHRDIKPANLYIDEQAGRLTVTDFGIARITGMHQTQTGVVLGSPSFMSPEQIRGESLTGASDIFSLGVTLYRALCGQLPFSGDTLPGLAYAITQTQQESPRKHNPEVPVALVRIVNKALKKNPDERYASAGEMAQALRKWAGAAE